MYKGYVVIQLAFVYNENLKTYSEYAGVQKHEFVASEMIYYLLFDSFTGSTKRCGMSRGGEKPSGYAGSSNNTE